jgi:hypothetical protein
VNSSVVREIELTQVHGLWKSSTDTSVSVAAVVKAKGGSKAEASPKTAKPERKSA